jgi:hypothetical protein
MFQAAHAPSGVLAFQACDRRGKGAGGNFFEELRFGQTPHGRGFLRRQCERLDPQLGELLATGIFAAHARTTRRTIVHRETLSSAYGNRRLPIAEAGLSGKGTLYRFTAESFGFDALVTSSYREST